ncbi:MAG: hypothetical protein E6Q42_04040 [Dechloromonas sp.]|nr:MAG: hypothetical protein E6Q42_04040 [Dechloromonas sp.]
MKKKFFAVVGLLAMTVVWAEDAREAASFSETSTLATLLERIPGTLGTVSWLPDVTLHRYDAARFDKDKSMVDVHRLFGQWCKAKSGRIFQPRENNCTFLKNGLGCAVGELQYPGLGSDFERGLKDAAGPAGETVQVGWPRAAWLISENVLFNIFANKGANQVSIVGGLQRCVADRNKLVNAMAFVSIDGNNDLLFFDDHGYAAIAKRGAELSKQVADKKKEEAAQKRAQETASVAALNAGDYVIHLKNGQRGMIVEMKPPLAQIQWDKGYGAKAVEWNRLEELKPEKSR